MHRAYSTFTIKSVDDDQRIIEGIASTPIPDSDGDIMEPEGAEFKLPLPFLYQHNSREPIGEVFAAKVSRDGITIKARVIKVPEPGRLKDRLDEAWQSIKFKLVRGLSVGFRPIESARLEGTYSFRFIKWAWHELSAVTVPANIDATIQTIKSLDTQQRAALGDRARSRPGASGQRSTTTMTLSERLTAAKAELKTKSDRLAEIMQLDESDGLDATQRDEQATLTGEIETIEARVKSLAALERAQIATARPVIAKAFSETERERENHQVLVKGPELPPGIGFARVVICKMASVLSNGSMSALEIAKARYPSDDRIATFLKTAVAGGTTTDSTWAAPLVDQTNLASEFIEFLRPLTIVGRFGTGNIPSLNRVPFNIRVTGQTSGGAGYWVGQGKLKPLKKYDFNAVTLLWAKAAAISVLSDELARFSSPSAETLVRNALAGSVIERLDTDFIDPDVAAVANVSPGAITNGITPIAPSGTDAAAVRTDVGKLLAEMISNKLAPASLVFIMPNTVALALSLLRNALGQKEFPDITMMGGTLEGIPVLASQYAATSTGNSPNYGGNIVALVAANEIFLADDGGVTVDASREASIEMSDNPEGEAGTVVSMFQSNQIALRAERYINWQRRRDVAVQYVREVEWGGAGSPAA